MKGDFKVEFQDGLWLLAPGEGSGTVGKLTVTRAGAAAGWEERIGYLAVEEIMPALQEMRGAKVYW